jgi:hypothetical protein
MNLDAITHQSDELVLPEQEAAERVRRSPAFWGVILNRQQFRRNDQIGYNSSYDTR